MEGNDKGNEFNMRAFSAKHKYQLIVRLKSYQIQKGYLLLFIILHNLVSRFQLVPTLWSLISVILDFCYFTFMMIFWQCNLLSASGLIAFMLGNIFCFWYCSHWPPNTSSLRHNLFYSWMMHLHPIIYPNPYAKPAGLSRVMSRPSTLAFATG